MWGCVFPYLNLGCANFMNSLLTLRESEWGFVSSSRVLCLFFSFARAMVSGHLHIETRLRASYVFFTLAGGWRGTLLESDSLASLSSSGWLFLTTYIIPYFVAFVKGYLSIIYHLLPLSILYHTFT
jgi:hypothetical protein